LGTPAEVLAIYIIIEVGIVNNRVMLWAGTPGAVLGPRHIDWGPGGCARARRSLLYGHSLNVGWAATTAADAAAAATTTTATTATTTTTTILRLIVKSTFGDGVLLYKC